MTIDRDPPLPAPLQDLLLLGHSLGGGEQQGHPEQIVAAAPARPSIGIDPTRQTGKALDEKIQGRLLGQHRLAVDRRRFQGMQFAPTADLGQAGIQKQGLQAVRRSIPERALGLLLALPAAVEARRTSGPVHERPRRLEGELDPASPFESSKLEFVGQIESMPRRSPVGVDVELGLQTESEAPEGLRRGSLRRGDGRQTQSDEEPTPAPRGHGQRRAARKAPILS